MIDNDNYNDPPEITDALNTISQKAANYTSPHATGSNAAKRARKQEKQFEENAKLKDVIPLAYAADGSIIFGKHTPPPKDTVDNEKPLLPNIIFGDQVPDVKIDFLWQDRFSYQFGLVAGRQGLGKSSFACYMAAKITNADVHSWDDGAPCPTGCVMFFPPEGQRSFTVRRIENMGGDKKYLAIYSGLGSGRKRPDGMIDTDHDPVVSDVTNLTRAIDAVEQTKGQKVHLIVIDPITDYMGGVKQNENGEVTAALRGLEYLASERNICIIGVKHLNKTANTSAALYSVGGSGAFTSKPRFVYILDQTPESRKAELEGNKSVEQRLLLVPCKRANDFLVKGSIEYQLVGEDDSFHVEIKDLGGSWTGDSLQWELLKINGGATKGRGRPADDELNAEIERLLDSGMSVKEVLKELEDNGQTASKSHVYKIFNSLKERQAESYSDFDDFGDDNADV